MEKQSVLVNIKKLDRVVFTTQELSFFSGKSLSATTQALNLLQKKGLVIKLYHGIWAETGNKQLTPYIVIPFLFPRHRAYISFISALHIYGIIEQIPQIITLASTLHTKVIQTKIATFSIHQITPLFFTGFNWYKGTGSFLIAEPEKALIDCLYLSARKKKQFSYFPELYFPKSFSFARAKKWATEIPNSKISSYVKKQLETISTIKS